MGWQTMAQAKRRRHRARQGDREGTHPPARPSPAPPFPCSSTREPRRCPSSRRGDRGESGSLLARADGPCLGPRAQLRLGQGEGDRTGPASVGDLVACRSSWKTTAGTSWPELPPGIKDPESVSPEEIRAAGAGGRDRGHGRGDVSRGGEARAEGRIDTVIVNGCECEPILTCDHRTLLERTDALLYGMRAIRHAVGAERVVLAIEANKPRRDPPLPGARQCPRRL